MVQQQTTIKKRAFSVAEVADMLGVHRTTFWCNFIKTECVRVIEGLGVNKISDIEVERLLSGLGASPVSTAVA
jgi:hypothetical protein